MLGLVIGVLCSFDRDGWPLRCAVGCGGDDQLLLFTCVQGGYKEMLITERTTFDT